MSELVIGAYAAAVVLVLGALFKGIVMLVEKLKPDATVGGPQSFPDGLAGRVAVLDERVLEVHQWTREEDRKAPHVAEMKRTLSELADTTSLMASSAVRDREDKVRWEAEIRGRMAELQKQHAELDKAIEKLLKTP